LGAVGRGGWFGRAPLIAGQLYISISTVLTHLGRIRDKTSCHRRADLTRLGLRAGLVTEPAYRGRCGSAPADVLFAGTCRAVGVSCSGGTGGEDLVEGSGVDVDEGGTTGGVA
jgi:hypothetical protein